MVVHLRQFVIGPEPWLVRPDWCRRELAPGVTLCHCPTLPVSDLPEGLLIGDALATADPDSGPGTWAGRWILYSGMQLRLDASGLLGCYYRRCDEGLWVSSSLEILRSRPPELPMHDDRLERDWRVMDWYPPPHSAIDGVQRLLPSQTLDVADGRLVRRALPVPDASAVLDDVIERSAERLIRAMRAAADIASSQGGRVWIGLTAGHDSRLVLAAAVAAQIEAMTYTFIRDKTSAGDRELPPRLAAAVGFDHVRIPMEVVDPVKAADFDRHTAAGYAGGARTQYTTGGWDRVEADAVALEGGCFEYTRGYYYDRLPRGAGSDPAAAAAAIVERFPTRRPAGVDAWARWALVDDPEIGLDWRDRFYLEQRLGGWLSAGLQGFDISGRRQVHVGNCEALLADLLSFPPRRRRAGEHQAVLVARLAPALAAFPTNPGSPAPAAPAPGGRFGTVTARRRFTDRLRRLGPTRR